MINPLLSKGRFLFVREGCPYCAMYKRFIFAFNLELQPEKRIQVIDCTFYDKFGMPNPIIDLFEPYIEGYPALVIDGEIKTGANSVLECKSFLKARLFNDFQFQQYPESLPIINKSTMFNKKCRQHKGRLFCKDE